MGKLDKLIKDLGIDETYTKPVKKQKGYTRVKDNVPRNSNYNFMADLLFLPKTKTGFNYLFVMVDLATDAFDIEPIKNKEQQTILTAMLNMFKRNFISKPYSSIRTDGGSEFKGVFAKYLYDNSILHTIALPDRHSQLSVVETLNKTLGRLLNGYMNAKEEQTGKSYNEWTDIVDIVRNELNKIRKDHNKNSMDKEFPIVDTTNKPKFKVGDIVYRQLEVPANALGNNQATKNFREGDYRWSIKEPRKITQILYYSGKVPYRYLLEGIKNASFTENQLMKAKDQEKESKYKVKEIIGKRKTRQGEYYLVWWDKYLKKDATWEPKKQLIEDGLQDMIDEFEKNNYAL